MITPPHCKAHFGQQLPDLHYLWCLITSNMVNFWPLLISPLVSSASFGDSDAGYIETLAGCPRDKTIVVNGINGDGSRKLMI